MAQHDQIAHVVRHFMDQHGQGGDKTQAQVGHEGGGNQDTVPKGMDTVAGEYGPAA